MQQQAAQNEEITNQLYRKQRIVEMRKSMEEELQMVLDLWGMPELGDEVVTDGAIPEMDAAAEEQLRALGYIE